jgi:hypothetical protein
MVKKNGNNRFLTFKSKQHYLSKASSKSNNIESQLIVRKTDHGRTGGH